MMQWQSDLRKANPMIGMELIVQPVNKMIDLNVYWFLQWYYLPMRMIARGDDVDRFISHFSLNGLKSSTLCQK